MIKRLFLTIGFYSISVYAAHNQPTVRNFEQALENQEFENAWELYSCSMSGDDLIAMKGLVLNYQFKQDEGFKELFGKILPITNKQQAYKPYRETDTLLLKSQRGEAEEVDYEALSVQRRSENKRFSKNISDLHKLIRKDRKEHESTVCCFDVFNFLKKRREGQGWVESATKE